MPTSTDAVSIEVLDLHKFSGITKTSIHTLPIDIIWQIASHLPPRTLLKCQKAFGRTWVPIDLTSIHQLSCDDRIPTSKSFINRLTASDWHLLGANYLTAYMVLTERFHVPNLASVDYRVASTVGELTQVFHIPKDNQEPLKEAFSLARSSQDLNRKLQNTIFSRQRGEGNMHLGHLRISAALGAGDQHLLSFHMLSYIKHRIEGGENSEEELSPVELMIHPFDEILMNACRNGCWDTIHCLKAMNPAEMPLNLTGILKMAARNGTIDFVKLTLEEFDITVGQETIEELIKDFSGGSTKIIEFLCRRAKIPFGEAINLALSLGNFAFVLALGESKSIPIEDVRRCAIRACCKALDQQNQQTLSSIPACRYLKSQILEQPPEFQHLVELSTFLLRECMECILPKCRSHKLFVFVEYLSNGIPNLHRFALVVGATEYVPFWIIRSILEPCIDDTEISDAVNLFVKNIKPDFQRLGEVS
ncbi:hypothetical protein HDU97_002350 [Phlyctochytrium planicorne]|nr:hypothetical protein HDU97_002350 [Phlyctochytrium planicorne]